MIDTSKVFIEDVGVLIVPMDCSDAKDGVPPLPILPSNELLFEELHFNIQNLTSYNTIKPSKELDKDGVFKIILGLV